MTRYEVRSTIRGGGLAYGVYRGDGVLVKVFLFKQDAEVYAARLERRRAA